MDAAAESAMSFSVWIHWSGATKWSYELKMEIKEMCAWAPVALIGSKKRFSDANVLATDAWRLSRPPWTKMSCYFRPEPLDSHRWKSKENEEAASYRSDSKLIWPKAILHSGRTFLPFSTQTFAAGPTSPALGIHSQHQHSVSLPALGIDIC